MFKQSGKKPSLIIYVGFNYISTVFVFLGKALSYNTIILSTTKSLPSFYTLKLMS